MTRDLSGAVFQDAINALYFFTSPNPYHADHNYWRFQPIFSVDQISVIGKEMCV